MKSTRAAGVRVLLTFSSAVLPPHTQGVSESLEPHILTSCGKLMVLGAGPPHCARRRRRRCCWRVSLASRAHTTQEPDGRRGVPNGTEFSRQEEEGSEREATWHTCTRHRRTCRPRRGFDASWASDILGVGGRAVAQLVVLLHAVGLAVLARKLAGGAQVEGEDELQHDEH